MSLLLWRTVFHKVSLIHHGYVIWCAAAQSAQKYEDRQIATAMKYGPRYLTYWNFSFQIIFLFVSLCYDLAQWTNRTHIDFMSRVRFYRDFIFHALVFPFTLYVAFTFWMLFSIDRELVYPRTFDNVVPWWQNHSVHTWILLVLALEVYLQPRHRTERAHYRVFLLVTGTYWVVYHMTYLVHGVWLYPFYDVMSWPQRVLWQFLYWISFQIFYDIQWPVLRYIHGIRDIKEESKTLTEGKHRGIDFSSERHKDIDESEAVKINGFDKRNGNNLIKSNIIKTE